VTAAAWTVVVVILAGCAAYAVSVLDGRQRLAYLTRAARYHIARRRYARRMLGPLPARDQDVPYSRREWLAILDAWDAPAARTEKTPT
jgi:hypothetical protein